MKKLIASTLLAVFLLIGNAAFSQNDTIYVIQDGVVLWKHATSSLDSIIFYAPSSIDTTTSIKDADGNVYTSVIIGTQEWMVENLRTTKYSDGTAIPNLTGNTEWANDTTGAWCHYDNDSQYDRTYGKLYNWYAVETGKLCPTGWHVPTWSESQDFRKYLTYDGHSGTEGKALKSKSGWDANGSGTDNYGWLGLPGGYRGIEGSFDELGISGSWWKANIISNFFLSSFDDAHTFFARPNQFKPNGFSVRCLKDSDTALNTLHLPTLNTVLVSDITDSSAITGGDITNDGGASVTSRGVVWGTSSNPSILDNVTVNGIGTGSFTSNITGLSASTNYYIRAYATNSVGTSYGNEITFTTKSEEHRNILLGTVFQINQGGVPKRMIVQYVNQGTEIQTIKNYDNLTEEQKAVFDSFENLSESLIEEIGGQVSTFTQTVFQINQSVGIPERMIVQFNGTQIIKNFIDLNVDQKFVFNQFKNLSEDLME